MATEPHIVSLVLQSKKALQYGEQLCTKAKNISNSSAQSAVDVLAVDAKVRWVTDAIVEQLKVGFTDNENDHLNGYSSLRILPRRLKRNVHVWQNKSRHAACLTRATKNDNTCSNGTTYALKGLTLWI